MATEFVNSLAISVDFYTSDEIKLAASTMSRYIQQRLPTHKGAERGRKSNQLKLIWDPAVGLPLLTFVAVDLSRLPPVDISHVMGRGAIHAVALLRSELDEVRGALHELKNLKPDGCCSIMALAKKFLVTVGD